VAVDTDALRAKEISQRSARKNLKSHLEVIQCHTFWHLVTLYRQMIQVVTFALSSAVSEILWVLYYDNHFFHIGVIHKRRPHRGGRGVRPNADKRGQGGGGGFSESGRPHLHM